MLEKKFSLKEALKQEDPKEYAFVYALSGVVLRRLGEIDAILKKFTKPIQDPHVVTVLRLGVAQILFLRVPPHAATYLAVEQAKKTPFAKLVNAVLRRVILKNFLDNEVFSEKINTPKNLWQGWCRSYGTQTARAIAKAHLNSPPTDLTCRPGRPGRPHPQGKRLPNGTVRLSQTGPVTALSGYKKGNWWVQDVASSLIVPLLGDVRAQAVLDMCAAPGGKTAQLAAAGAYVTALEIDSQRIQQLKKTVKRLDLHVKIFHIDALQWQKPCARILLDVPCSATGTIRRNPDILHIPRKNYTHVQSRLLRHAVKLLTPGGFLVYACCSLEPEEGEHQIEKILKKNSELERFPIRAKSLGAFEDSLITPKGDLRTLPCYLSDVGGMDGFYAARLAKKNTSC